MKGQWSLSQSPKWWAEEPPKKHLRTNILNYAVGKGAITPMCIDIPIIHFSLNSDALYIRD